LKGIRDVVDTYLAEALLPSIPQGSVIVLDTPPSTVEHVWVTLKGLVRGGLQAAQDKVALIEEACDTFCVKYRTMRS